MVRPVCIDNLQLCDAGVTVFIVLEIIAAEAKVSNSHCKTGCLMVSGNLLVTPADKAVDTLNVCRHFGSDVKILGLVHRSLTGLDGVDEVGLDCFVFCIGHIALKDVYLCTGNCRLLLTGEKCDTLCCRVSTLIILTGEILACKEAATLGHCELGADCVCVRLGEHSCASRIELLGCETLNIVTVDQAHFGKRCDAQR